jgi:hypothetical protein
MESQGIEEARNYLVGLSIGLLYQLVNPINLSTIPGSAGKLVPGGIPGFHLGLRWTCNVCVGTNLGVNTKPGLRIRENKLLIPK